jgi:hypothetical protein
MFVEKSSFIFWVSMGLYDSILNTDQGNGDMISR